MKPNRYVYEMFPDKWVEPKDFGKYAVVYYGEKIDGAAKGKNWKESKELFQNYLDSSDSASSANSDNANQRAFALFYLGFAQFRLSEFNEAYENLFDFAGSNPESSLAWYAYFTSASAAVYAGDFFMAQKASEAGLSAADTVQKKQESVMQCASVYSDSGEGEKAEKLLQPYFKQNNHFGNQCGFALYNRSWF